MSYVIHDYLCDQCGHRTEEMVPRHEQPDAISCARCGTAAYKTLSAPLLKMPRGWVGRGSLADGYNAELPPGVVDDRPLAEGMPYDEWKAQLRKKRHDETHARIKDELGMGKFERIPE